MHTLVTRLSNYLSVLAGLILLFMTGLTFVDVLLRYFGKPIVGAYELVAFLGVAVSAFALPRASLKKAHVYVDIVVDKLPSRWHTVFRVFTRILVFLMFFFAIFYFLFMARNFIATHSVTMTLKVPFYPVVFALAASCIVQCLACVCEIMDDVRGRS